MTPMKALCVFCGSREGARAAYRDAATELGGELARRGITLVFGGGRVGLMGVVADAVLAGGGAAIGVMPRGLVDREIAHRGLTQLHVVETMHERKQLMADLADAFVLLPGGFGSWDEFCEVVTWAQLGIHAKPCGVLNVADYYGALFAQAALGVEHGFIERRNLDAIVVQSNPAALLDALGDALSAAHLRGQTTP
jgi:uncharacterized protein (TIGR00730 family)